MRKLCVVPFLFAILLAGCSSGSNQASAPPSDANANAAPPVAQNAPPPAPDAQLPALTPLAPTQPLIKPDSKPALGGNTKSANANIGRPPTASKASGPKLILPLGNIDFGNVNQGKSLTRNLVVKNTGKANLNIDSVVPS